MDALRLPQAVATVVSHLQSFVNVGHSGLCVFKQAFGIFTHNHLLISIHKEWDGQKSLFGRPLCQCRFRSLSSALRALPGL
jgi:hypothetical protein